MQKHIETLFSDNATSRDASCGCGIGALDQECDAVTGQCHCGCGVGGVKCDTCLDGYHHLTAMITNSDGTHSDALCHGKYLLQPQFL